MTIRTKFVRRHRRRVSMTVIGVLSLCLTGCAEPQLIGLAYTHVKLPLTRNLHDTKMPDGQPAGSRVVEIREPVSGFGCYARVNSNAVGDIAKCNGMETLYFADQEIFSLLGIWNSVRVHVYGQDGK